MPSDVAVREAASLEVGDELDLLGNVVGGARQHVGRFDVQRWRCRPGMPRVYSAAISHAAAAGAARALLHLVLAGVGVGRQVADIGDVHHVPHAIAVPVEHALQRVLEQERSVVADVLEVVDGRSARVEADGPIGHERRELAQAARKVVVEPQGLRLMIGHNVRTMMKSSMTKPPPIGKSPRARIANPHAS